MSELALVLIIFAPVLTVTVVLLWWCLRPAKRARP